MKLNRTICLVIWVFAFSTLPAIMEFDRAEAGYRSTLLRLHNKERRNRGRRKLRINSNLNRAAVKYAREMKQNERLSHVGVGGSTVADRVTAEGYRFSTVGENIAFGYTSPRAVHNAWMRSAGHRRNILRGVYRDVGFGKSGLYWCTVFGKRL